jgi:hypothetical protein
MPGITKATGVALVLAAIALLLMPAVSGQGLGKKGGRSNTPAEKGPVVDEKAYKAALDRIPTPKQGYDPWGQARQSEQPKTTKKPN